MHDLWSYLLPFLFINELVWFSFLYFNSRIFKRPKNRSQIYSYFFGWVAVSFIVFVLSTAFARFEIMTPQFVWGVFIILFTVNFAFLFKDKKHYLELIDISTLKYKLAFWGLFLLMYFILSLSPQINQIERFMDFGFVATLLNSTSLPLEDVWFVGLPTNYYYFGHFIVYIMTVLSGVGLEQVFFMAVCFIFAFLAVGSFEIGSFVTSKILLRENSMLAIFGGLVSGFFVIFSGPLFTVDWIYKYILYKLGNSEEPFFWYAEATRVLKGTITEFPFFSFLEANTHAHVWGYVIAIIVIALLAEMYFDGLEGRLEYKFSEGRFFVLSFVLGIAFMTNTWDVITLGTLSIVILGLIFLKYSPRIIARDVVILVSGAILVFVATTCAWYFYFQSPVSGLGSVVNHSNPLEWFYVWGIFVIIFLAFLISFIFSKRDIGKEIYIVFGIVFCGFMFLGFAELFYIKDILSQGEWFRANTYFKITAQVWAWFGLASGPVIALMLFGLRSKYFKLVNFIVICFLILIGVTYTFRTVKYFIDVKTYNGLVNPVEFLNDNTPYDYDAYLYLKNKRDGLELPHKKKIILEASGDSYTHNNYFSVLLGWPSVIGWPVHEWTWRGSYDEVGIRRAEVGEIYQGDSIEKSEELLRKYKVDYIVVGETEQRIYGDYLKTLKLRNLGEVVFENEGIFIIKTNL